jgi:hypothetical protein
MKLNVSRRKFIASAAAVIPPAIAYAQPKGGGFLSFLANEPKPTKAKKTDWKDAGVIDLSTSPYAKLKTVPRASGRDSRRILVATTQDEFGREHSEHA